LLHVNTHNLGALDKRSLPLPAAECVPLDAAAAAVAAAGEETQLTLGPAAANYLNPLGRASMQRPSAAMLARASVIPVSVLLSQQQLASVRSVHPAQ
jgi:hypothetical protein